ncbi:alpha/beta fold hydrolase [Amycolatopsis keratiniphila]|uniref:alpha/beta fold hydrolase n=1 Tax=Amycolatopsis keratiniphila TaxID=129921 RepID=UPI00087CE11B|nr:alpha/beta fold hydrolase [Amycolatopsis keratiniphila]OLZ50190.1 class II poly(R)-hydroxyalkanoic acid synthase [Amycolatopsis keratiniphila subsp. nogabecina]SDU66728.1 polyhydroxyalkanoate synthase [Amycolatopsis keratiniphila]
MTSNADNAAAADSIGGPNPIVGFRRKDLLDSLGSVLSEAAHRPAHTAGSLAHLAKAAADAVRGRVLLQPAPKDRRFADTAWSENFLYRRLLQFYLAADRELDSWIDGTELSDLDRERARFVLSLGLDALAPSNLPLNPLAVKRFVDTGGGSAVSGLRQLVADLRSNGGLPSQVDTARFAVGENLAVTEGSVVFRNEVLELIQYTPRTEKVHVRPLVIAPPQINKFYVFDLSPEKSLVRYALDGGQQVFMISWRNPSTEQRDWDLGTYLTAAEEALEAVSAITRSPDINLLGACSGGITAVSLAAYVAARDKPLIHAITLFVSVFDTAEDRTLLGTFASEEAFAAAKRRSHAKGVLDGRELGRMFSLLRPNDLIWSYWVNNYLLGKKPPAFDVLYWNNDTTRLPAALHGQFIDIYRDNLVATPGAIVVNGTPIDLAKVGADAFVLAGTTDHITPWDACYRSSTRLTGGVEFVLSNSGHIQSILNPPSNPKATHFRNAERPATAQEWQNGAEKVVGSWWPHWLEWLTSRAGERKKAPAGLGDPAHAPIEAAPGSYVRG